MEFLFLVFFNLLSFHQKNQEKVYTIVESQAEFPGGIAVMGKYIQKNLNYPVAKKNCKFTR